MNEHQQLLDGQVAIVTGGGSGIGRAITERFVDNGCSVTIVGRSRERLEKVADELSHRGRVDVVSGDVTVERDVEQVFRSVQERFGRLDIVVNNAGAFDGGPPDELSIDTWQRVLDVNVTGVFLCAREAFRAMKASGGGRIINIGSIAGHRSRPNSVPYTTSKYAVRGLTQALALDGRDHGIAVSCLEPGNTAVERRLDSGDDEDDEPMMPLDDVARTALLMATLSPGSTMLEAIVLPVTQAYVGRG